MTYPRRTATLLSPALALLLLTGCGNPGLPLPPSLMLPQPATDLGADRSAAIVSLHWTMPRRTTDRVLLQGDQRAAICRALGDGPCRTVAVLLVEAGKPASFTEVLSPPLATGPLRLLRYEVHLQNHAGRDGGPSNPAFVAGGSPPPSVLSVAAQATARGIAVQWQSTAPAAASAPSGAQLLARITRERILAPGESAAPAKGEQQSGVPQPILQTLETPQHLPSPHGGAPASLGSWTPDSTLDADAAMHRTYRYSVQLVERVSLAGHTLELSGGSAHSAPLTAEDTFPPAIPVDLAAVADRDGGSIDLSWRPGAEPDLAGYVVYRREADAAPDHVTRISGPAPVPTPNWSDTLTQPPGSAVLPPQPGVRYAYSVTAVDTSGNESARSAEVEEVLPR